MTATKDLTGRMAVVSGAGSGIGAALAREAAALGMKVLALDVDGARLDVLADSMRAAGEQVRVAVVDVSDPAAVSAVAGEAIADWGPAALIGGNAGVELAARTWEMTPAQWRHLQGVNLDGVFHLVHAFLPASIADGRPAHVLLTSSVGGLSSGAGQAAYIVSKHGVRVLAECLRADLAEAGHPIGVSVLLPGPVRTSIFSDAVATGPTGESLRTSLAAMLDEHGAAPADVARLAFEAVQGDRFWVHPHQSLSAAFIEAHHQELLAGL